MLNSSSELKLLDAVPGALVARGDGCIGLAGRAGWLDGGPAGLLAGACGLAGTPVEAGGVGCAAAGRGDIGTPVGLAGAGEGGAGLAAGGVTGEGEVGDLGAAGVEVVPGCLGLLSPESAFSSEPPPKSFPKKLSLIIYTLTKITSEIHQHLFHR
jgi:hypothetical protein